MTGYLKFTLISCIFLIRFVIGNDFKCRKRRFEQVTLLNTSAWRSGRPAKSRLLTNSFLFLKTTWLGRLKSLQIQGRDLQITYYNNKDKDINKEKMRILEIILKHGWKLPPVCLHQWEILSISGTVLTSRNDNLRKKIKRLIYSILCIWGM